MIQRQVDLSASYEVNDTLPQRYIKASAKLDEAMADPYLSRPALRGIFHSLQGELDSMIKYPDFRNNGDYIFHIDARLQEAQLGALYFRAEHGYDVPMPVEIIDRTLHSTAQILQDFDVLYSGRADQVNAKRTEVEVFSTLLVAAKDYAKNGAATLVPYTASFREDSSRTTDNNHDIYIPYDEDKISIEVKTADYLDRKSKDKRSIKDRYAESNRTLVVIHGELVASDSRRLRPKLRPVEENPYDRYDPDNHTRYINWGAFQHEEQGQLSDAARQIYRRMSNEERKTFYTRTLIKNGLRTPLNRLEYEVLHERAYQLRKDVKRKISEQSLAV